MKKYFLIMLTLSLCSLFVIIPQWQEAQKNNAQLAKASARLAIYQDFAKEKDCLEESLAQAEKLKILRYRLPQRFTASEKVDFLYALAEQNNIEVKQVKLPQHQKQNAEFLAVQINITGDYKNVLHFLEKLEREGSFAILEKVNLRGEEVSGKVTVNMQVNFYTA